MFTDLLMVLRLIQPLMAGLGNAPVLLGITMKAIEAGDEFHAIFFTGALWSLLIEYAGTPGANPVMVKRCMDAAEKIQAVMKVNIAVSTKNLNLENQVL
jgi:hypothetical protein